MTITQPIGNDPATQEAVTPPPSPAPLPVGPLRDLIDVRRVQGTLLADLQRLRDYAVELKLDKSIAAIDEGINHLQSDSFTIAVVGEFKRGKSTFINALMGQDVLPSDILPCTATLNRVIYALHPSITVKFKDGHSEEIDISALNSYVTKLTAKSRDLAATVEEAVVRYPVPYLQNNVVIYDTPGLNDEANMDAVTNEIVPTVDAAILVIMAGSPFSQYEADFLENKLLAADLGRVIFLVTRIDSLDSPEDADRVINYVKERVRENFLLRAEQLYGRDSDQYRTYVRKIGEPKVFGVSAKTALEAKLANDATRLATSRFPVFEDALQRFLTEERGPVMLQVPLNRVLTIAGQVLTALTLRENGLQMERDQFAAAYDQSTQQITELRQKKRAEMTQIDQARVAVMTKVRPLIDGLQNELIKAAEEAIDKVSISRADVQGAENQKKLTARLNAAVTDVIKNASHRFVDRVQSEVQQGLDAEVDRLRGFTTDVDDVISGVTAQFTAITSNTDAQRNTGVETALAAASLYTGFGGIWSGYRKGGAAGAVVGGATSVGVLIATGALLGILAIPVTLPIVVVAAIIGTLTGGRVVELVMANTIIKNFRQNYRDKLCEEIARQIASQNVPRRVNDEIMQAFDTLKNKFAEEIEAVLDNTEKTLNELRDKRARDVVLTDQEREDLAAMRAETQRILGNAQRQVDQIVPITTV